MSPEPFRYMLVAKLFSYLEKHQDAVRALTDGIGANPRSPHLYRHRGEFRIVLREFSGAVEDLGRAADLSSGMDDEIDYYQAELLPEMERLLLGSPPALLQAPTPINGATLDALRNVYKGSLKSSIWYHLALARYLKGDFDEAADLFRTTLEYGIDDDLRVAASDWLYLSLKRAGQDLDAQRLLDDTNLDIRVNSPVYLQRLRLYKGEQEPETAISANDGRRAVATVGYGLGSWYRLNGQTQKAAEAFERVFATGDASAFGYIAAEVDMALLDAA